MAGRGLSEGRGGEDEGRATEGRRSECAPACSPTGGARLRTEVTFPVPPCQTKPRAPSLVITADETAPVVKGSGQALTPAS